MSPWHIHVLVFREASQNTEPSDGAVIEARRRCQAFDSLRVLFLQEKQNITVNGLIYVKVCLSGKLLQEKSNGILKLLSVYSSCLRHQI